MTDPALVISIVVGTLLFLTLAILVVLLLVVNTNRRNRHRAELAEVQVRHAHEVRRVEQEVLRQTLTEVGHDLHDNIGQLLTVGRMGVNEMIRQAPDLARAQEVKDTLDATIGEVRRLSRVLNADRWEDRSLVEAVQQECDRVLRLGLVDVVFVHPAQEAVLEADRKLVLFRLFQEALNNALKHAQAARIEVLLSDGDPPAIIVRDDGRGFDRQAVNATGQGLHNLERRAGLIGYACTVHSSPEGTTVHFAPA